MQINIEDIHLQEQIAHYISDKHIQANDFMVELLEHFFQKEETPLNYKIIASTCLINNLPIATYNLKDFKYISNLEIV